MERSKLIRALCALEGKKSQVSVGNMREVVSQLEYYIAERAKAAGQGLIDPFTGPLAGVIDRAQTKLDKMRRVVK